MDLSNSNILLILLQTNLSNSNILLILLQMDLSNSNILLILLQTNLFNSNILLILLQTNFSNSNILLLAQWQSCRPVSERMWVQIPLDQNCLGILVTIEICATCYEYTFIIICLLYTSPSPRDKRQSRMPSSA